MSISYYQRSGGAITPHRDAGWHLGAFGEKSVMINVGNEYAAEIVDNNTIRVKSGVGFFYGIQVDIDPNTYEDWTIESGTLGESRIDTIGYTLNGTTCEKTVWKASGHGSVDEGDYWSNGDTVYVGLYEVYIDELTVESVTPLFTKYSPNDGSDGYAPYNVERQIATYLGTEIYEKYVRVSASDFVSSSSLATIEIDTGVAKIKPISVNCVMQGSGSSKSYPLPYQAWSTGLATTYLGNINYSDGVAQFRNKESWGSNYYLIIHLVYMKG